MSHSLRQHLPLAPKQEDFFQWRGKEVRRIEGLTDAVFAFAVTLLVVALEVPRTFEGLMDVVKTFPAFVACFGILMAFWSAHYRYFRRYGIEDGFTQVTTIGILVLVLFSVYPLKFLFTLVFANLFHLTTEHVPHLETRAQARVLYALYGGGFAGVYFIYVLMYLHALKLKNVLGLNTAELIITKAGLYEYIGCVAICLTSVVLAYTTESDSLPGLIYIAWGPLQIINLKWHSRKLKRTKASAQP